MSNQFKKVVALMLVVVMCGSSAVNAFSFGTASTGSTNIFKSFFSKIFNKEEQEKTYTLENLNIDLSQMKISGQIDLSKIEELIAKLPQGEDKNYLESITGSFSGLSGIFDNLDLSTLLDTLMGALTSLMGTSSSDALPVEAKSIYMDAKTAVEFAGSDYAAELHANVYMHVDENGKEDSDKWALVIHPFMLKGETMASTVGPFYYEVGYNIIAPDLRGFGDSEGSVALGFLESLDIYDWLNKLNAEYDVSQVVIHGVSLGGATTNFTSGIDEMINNGPTKINTKLKSLEELNVFALIEDCGYADMTEFADKDSLVGMDIGLTEENFDYYSKATNSLKYCEIPILIIHGTSDSTVDPENADVVKNTVKGDAEQWIVDGGAHAFIIMGSNEDEYKAHVQEFIAKYEKKETAIVNPVNNANQEVETKVEVEEVEEEATSTTSFFGNLFNIFKK